MDREHAFLTFSRDHHQLDLPFLDEVDRLAFISNRVDMIVLADLDSTRVLRFVEQRTLHLFFELIRSRSLLNHSVVVHFLAKVWWCLYRLLQYTRSYSEALCNIGQL